MKRRLWRKWPSRLLAEFNTVGGLIGFVSIGLGIVPFADPPPLSNLSQIFLCTGSVTCIVFAGYAISKSWPVAVLTVQEIVGQSISLENLDRVDPQPFRVGIVGPSYSGKSTLMRGIAALAHTQQRTMDASAIVVNIPTCPHRAIALIDGGGQFFADQFRVAETAEMLILILDHNQSETELRLSDARTSEHDVFGKQLREQLRRKPKKKHLQILANKQDIWNFLSKTDAAAFDTFAANQMLLWENSNLFASTSMAKHSNKSSDNIAFIDRVIAQNA